MKKMLFALLMVCLMAVTANAFLYEIEMLAAKELKKLTNEELIEVHTEAKIEEKASSEFHKAAGFSSAKDYKKRKKLLRYIIDLRREMSIRGIEPEPIDEWLK